MARQWIRVFKFEIEGTSWDFSGLRVRFIVRQTKRNAPGLADLRIYNLSPNSIDKLVPSVEGKKVKITAGYQSNAGIIYQGEILKAQAGRESPTDTYVDISCTHGDKPYNHGHISKTFAAGSKQQDHVDEVLKIFGDDGIKKGIIQGLSTIQYPRAVTLYGMARDVLRMLALSNNATWYLNSKSNTLNFVPLSYDNGDSPIELRPDTGLIGMPQQSHDGTIVATALINPDFDVEKHVKIKASSINPAPWSGNEDVTSGLQDKENTAGRMDGEYIIDGIEWNGDTYGNEWYATLYMHGISGHMSDSQKDNYTVSHGDAPQGAQ